MVGHAEDEDPLALVARANFRRSEQSNLNRKTKLAKVSPNPLGSSDFVSPRREHPGNVLDKDEPRPCLDNDASGIAPEISRIETPLLASGETMRLARNAANDAINHTTPCAAIEGSGIAPHSCRM